MLENSITEFGRMMLSVSGGTIARLKMGFLSSFVRGLTMKFHPSAGNDSKQHNVRKREVVMQQTLT